MHAIITTATVIAQDGDGYGLQVICDLPIGGQSPSSSVDVMTHGPRDALRISQPPLPTKGTRGLVCFPRGDVRSGIWLGSIKGPFNDAQASIPGSENIEYHAHFSGAYFLLDEKGHYSAVFPDGSAVLAGSGAVPVPVRHTLTSGSVRQATPFPLSERLASSGTTARPYAFLHATGAQFAVDVSGSVAVSGAPGQTVTLAVNGASVVINTGGDVTLTPMAGAKVNLGGVGGPKVARVGDPVNCPDGTGYIADGSNTVYAVT